MYKKLQQRLLSTHKSQAFACTSPAAAARSRSLSYERVEQLDGHGEDDGGVLLGGDAVEGLEVAELERRRGLVDDVGGLLERVRSLVLPLRCYYLQQQQPELHRVASQET